MIEEQIIETINKLRKDVNGLLTRQERPGPWIDYSAISTVVGFSGAPTKVIYVHRDAAKKMVHVVAFLAGTSNATTLSFTVPANCATATTVSVMCPVMDNGSRSHGTATIGGNTVSVNKDLFQAFTASGNKEVRLSMWWFIP